MGAAEKKKRAPAAAHDDCLPELVKPERVAEWIGVSRAVVYQMVHVGEIPPHCVARIGRRLRFYADQLRSWLAEQQGSSRTSAK
jgi:excisionase family DNA binding protein